MKKNDKNRKKNWKEWKKYLATRGIEPRTAGMLSRSLAPRPRGKLDFGRKKIDALWSLESTDFRENPVDPRD